MVSPFALRLVHHLRPLANREWIADPIDKALRSSSYQWDHQAYCHICVGRVMNVVHLKYSASRHAEYRRFHTSCCPVIPFLVWVTVRCANARTKLQGTALDSE